VRDWDLSISGDLYYDIQSRDDKDLVYNTSADAFHVSYQKVAKYVSGQARKNPTLFNGFSASLYIDG
jgi:hypothetical protein